VIEYTTVVGTDEKHFQQLSLVYLTWIKHKSSLLKHPMILFADNADRATLTEKRIRELIVHPDLKVVYWPPEGVVYEEKVIDSKHKFGKAQRYKMMAGFVHVPAAHVETEYWLKLDSDAVALGQDDWIDPDWFILHPSIVGHRWGFTKPSYFPLYMDDWCEVNMGSYFSTNRMDLPLDSPTSERISHPRISSWCAFFASDFTREAAYFAKLHCGEGMLPIPSQDTYLWYMAARIDPNAIVRVNMKGHGWTYRSNYNSVCQLVREALDTGVKHGV